MKRKWWVWSQETNAFRVGGSKCGIFSQDVIHCVPGVYNVRELAVCVCVCGCVCVCVQLNYLI